MKKLIFALVLVILGLGTFAQDVDVAAGIGHLWMGSGSYYAGADARELDLQLTSKITWGSGAGIYAGFTQDGYKLAAWGNKHNFTTLDTSSMIRLKALDLGACYVLKGEKLKGWAAIGVAGYDSLGTTAAGAFAAVGADLMITQHLYAQVKAEWRGHCTDFTPLQAAAFETGLLLGWKF